MKKNNISIYDRYLMSNKDYNDIKKSCVLLLRCANSDTMFDYIQDIEYHNSDSEIIELNDNISSLYHSMYDYITFENMHCYNVDEVKRKTNDIIDICDSIEYEYYTLIHHYDSETHIIYL